jgi:hypothetical protein
MTSSSADKMKQIHEANVDANKEKIAVVEINPPKLDLPVDKKKQKIAYLRIDVFCVTNL